MEITVLNKRNLSDPLPGVARVYVGRPSLLGNPFPMRKESERNQVCDQYLDWLRTQYKENPAVRAKLHWLAGLAKRQPVELVCYCAPLRCHADSIKAAVLAIAKQSTTP